MRGRLRGRGDARRLRAVQVLDRLARRQVHQMHRPSRLAGEIDVACDHQALAQRRPAADTELRCDRSRVRVAATRQGLLFAVHGDHAPGDGVVLQRAPHHAGVRDRASVVGEARSAGVGKSAHLGQLRSLLAARDRDHEPDRHARLLGGPRAKPA